MKDYCCYKKMFIKRRCFVKSLTYYCSKQCCVFKSFGHEYYDKKCKSVYHKILLVLSFSQYSVNYKNFLFVYFLCY